nr:glycerophosphodiester phosphodiesterase family protein [Tissierella sp.]
MDRKSIKSKDTSKRTSKETSGNTSENNTKDILKNSFKNFYHSIVYLLLFELIWKGLILAIFKPLRTGIVSLFVKAKEYDIVMNQQGRSILFLLAAWVLITASIFLLIAMVYYEITVIIMILNRIRNKEKVNLLEINRKSLTKLKGLFMKKRIGLFVYILSLIPLLNIGIQIAIFPALSVPNIIRSRINRFPGSTIVLALGGLFLLYLFVKLFIVIPIMTFTDKSFKESVSLSFKKLKGRKFKLALLISLGLLACIIISRVPFFTVGNFRYRMPRMLKSISNSLIAIITLFITPFFLSASLETFTSYGEMARLETEDKRQSKKKLGLAGTLFGKILDPLERFIENLSKNKAVLIILTLILTLALNIYGNQGSRPIVKKQLVIGHRGGDYGVENTVDTIVFAGSEGADYVEIDVLLTKDNVPVVIHDNDLKRLAEEDEKISELEIGEVEEVTIESEKETKDKKDSIPTLVELVREFKGESNLMLEFKLHGEEKESVVDKTMKILEEEGILEDTIFQTAEFEIIQEFNEKYKDFNMGYIYKSKKKSVSIDKALEAGADFISSKGTKIDNKMVKKVHKAKKTIFAWTINSVYEAEKLLNLGVDGIITDIPLEMIELVDRYNN